MAQNIQLQLHIRDIFLMKSVMMNMFRSHSPPWRLWRHVCSLSSLLLSIHLYRAELSPLSQAHSPGHDAVPLWVSGARCGLDQQSPGPLSADHVNVVLLWKVTALAIPDHLLQTLLHALPGLLHSVTNMHTFKLNQIKLYL